MMLRALSLSLFFIALSAPTAWANDPDLKVTDISLDSECYAVVTVKNAGAALSDIEIENSRVSIHVGTAYLSRDLSSFDPQGALKPAGGSFITRVGNSPVESARIRVEMDSNSAIPESRENNNAMAKTLTCPSYSPEQYEEVIINVESWRLLDDCSVEATFVNEGPGRIDPKAYTRNATGGSGNPIFTVVAWAGAVRSTVWLDELDPQRKLQPQGGRLTYTYATGTLGNKVFKGTDVKVMVNTLVRPNNRGRDITQRVWCAPDLAVEEITQKPAKMVGGERGWLKAKITNKGWVTSKPTTAQIKVGGESTPSEAPVPALAPGKSHYVNREVLFDRMGSFRIAVAVDPKKEQYEAKEVNNKAKRNVLVESPPGKTDLRVSNLSLDDKCRVLVELENLGPGWLPMKVYDKRIKNNIDLFLFKDGKGWGGAAIHTFDRLRALQPKGGKVTYRSRLRIAKSNKIRAIVDKVGRLHEGNEQNNAFNRELECAPKKLTPIAPIKAKPLRPAPRRPTPKRRR